MAIAEDAATVLEQFIHDGKVICFIYTRRQTNTSQLPIFLQR